jgi:hypothetical protein
MDEKATVLYFYRKLVYVLYLEIGALQHRNHPELAAKARLKTAFFQREKEKQAAALYRLTETEDLPARIVAPYEERTGLSLKDVRRAFAEGDWRNKFSQYTFGGPRWVQIADVTLELEKLIEQEEWEKASELLFEIKKLKTNQGFLVSHFERGDRRDQSPRK